MHAHGSPSPVELPFLRICPGRKWRCDWGRCRRLGQLRGRRLGQSIRPDWVTRPHARRMRSRRWTSAGGKMFDSCGSRMPTPAETGVVDMRRLGPVMTPGRYLAYGAGTGDDPRRGVVGVGDELTVVQQSVQRRFDRKVLVGEFTQRGHPLSTPPCCGRHLRRCDQLLAEDTGRTELYLIRYLMCQRSWTALHPR
jgi:hypothetical protein